MTNQHPTRRTALVALTLPWVAGCSALYVPPGRSGGATANRPTTDAPPTPLPTPPPYVILPGELQPSAKQAAVDAVTAVLTWGRDDDPAGGATRLAAVGAAPGIAANLQRLTGANSESTLKILYPQYAGLPADLRTASVMVVATQTYRTAGQAASSSREVIIDVRLKRGTSGWQATQAILPVLPAPAPSSSAAVRRVLANRRILLPAPAQADVRGGIIDERLLAVMEELAKRWELSVLDLKSGHPRNVFGTNRISNHTRGRAVDIWAIDGIPVIDQKASQWRALMREAGRLGANEIGGPADLDKVAGRRPYFTNKLHQDHVHVGFDGMKTPTSG